MVGVFHQQKENAQRLVFVTEGEFVWSAVGVLGELGKSLG